MHAINKQNNILFANVSVAAFSCTKASLVQPDLPSTEMYPRNVELQDKLNMLLAYRQALGEREVK